MTHDEAVAAMTAADQKTRGAVKELIEWARCAPTSPGDAYGKIRDGIVRAAAAEFKGATRRVQSALTQPSTPPEWLAGEIGHFERETTRLIDDIVKRTAKKSESKPRTKAGR